MPDNRPSPLYKVGDEVYVHNKGYEVFTISRVNPTGEPEPHQSHAYYYKDDSGDEYFGTGRGYYEGVFRKVTDAG